MRACQDRGFSLIELMLSGVLLSLLLLLGLSSLRTAPARTGTKGAATAVKAFLEEAASLARARNIPVAIGIPDGAYSSELFLLSGHQDPRIVQRLNLGGDFPGVVLMTGSPSTSSPPSLGLSDGTFDPNVWESRHPKMKLLAFLPSGEVRSRGVPFWNDGYPLLLSYGASSGDSENGPTRVAFPQTVSIGPLGDIRQTTGAGIAFGNPEEVAAALPSAPTVSGLTVSGLPEPPRLKPITIFPNPDRIDLPPGVDAKVDPSGYLTMVSQAESDENVPLYCQWITENGDGGRLSASEKVPMTYDRVKGYWVSQWHWRPPDVYQDKYRVECQITDIFGQKAIKGSIVTTLDIGVSQAKQRLLFGSDNRFGTGTTLLTMLEDGAGEKRLFVPSPGDQDRVGAWSPDGARIVTSFRGNGQPDQLYVVNADGSDRRPVTSGGGGAGNPEWSPTGTSIAFNRESGGVRDVWVVSADGSTTRNLTSGFSPDANLNLWQNGYLPAVWSPDEKYIAFFASQIWVVNVATKATAKVSGSKNATRWAWAPNSKEIALLAGGEIFTYPLDETWPSEPTRRTQNAQANTSLQYSPDGSKIVFLSSGNLETVAVTAFGVDPTTPTPTQQITSGGGCACPGWLDDETLSYRKSEDIYVLTLGEAPKNLTDHPRPDWFYGWTKDLSGVFEP